MVMTLGEAVKRRRLELRLTQRELAERLGLDPSHVTKVEIGHTYRRIPGPEEFLKWADALEMSPETLLRQIGYLGEDLERGRQPVEQLFAQLADEIRAAENMPAEVQDTMLDGLRIARRMYEVKTGSITKS